MPQREIHECQCHRCQQTQWHRDRDLHAGMNLLLSRLDEQQRRWYVALESTRVGYGGDRQLSRITGMNVETIRRGREELAEGLQGRPADRARLPGGGRQPVEKKTPLWSPT